MHEKWLPKTFEGRMFRLVEECAEVVWHHGKIGRFGLLTRWPHGGATNAQKLLAELADLEDAIARVRPELEKQAAVPGNEPPRAGRQVR